MTYTKSIISDYITLRVSELTEYEMRGTREFVWDVPNVWYANQRSNVCTVEMQAGLIRGEVGNIPTSEQLQAETVTPIVPDDTLEDDITDSIVEGHPEFVAAGDTVTVNNFIRAGAVVYYNNGAQNAADTISQKSPLGIGHSPNGQDDKGLLIQSCGKLLVTARPHQIRLSVETLEGVDVEGFVHSACFTLRFDYYDSDDVAREMHKEMEHML